jgi:uncharacterized membrane protein
VNKNEFLKQLSGNLKKMTREEQDEIMADFNEYFTCAAGEGGSEEATCARLGDPRKIAKEYYSQKMIEEANRQKSFKSMGRAVMASAGLGIANFFYAVCVVAVGYIVIASLYIAVCSAGLGAVAAFVSSVVWFGAVGAAAGFMSIFVSLALASLCVLGFIGVMKLAVLFSRSNMRFLNMTRREFKGGISNE